MPTDPTFLSLNLLPDEQELRPNGTRHSLHFRKAPLADPREQIRHLRGVEVVACSRQTGRFADDLHAAGWPALHPGALEIFQINLGKLCNMTCRHCHVDAGPDRTAENMDRETVDLCLRALDRTSAHTVDLTGGAPELNPHFSYLVEECLRRGKKVIDRCNLTILTTNRYTHLPRWLAERGVEIVSSLPHHHQDATDAQRGEGTFERSIRALRLLNAEGYGQGRPDRVLTLVSNPVGDELAGCQGALEKEWKATLEQTHGITFDRLIVLNNMPVSRFLEWLVQRGRLQPYLERLIHLFNPCTIAGLMCRNTLSVSWDGRLFDCDFNQQLDLEMRYSSGRVMHVRDFDPEVWAARTVRTERHCYGCTAGHGSSCSGSLA